jgi:alpha-L-glutamate ligase-like protein
MNRRNVSYISRYNPRGRYPLVDNKLKTKLLAEKFNVSTPTLKGIIRYQYEISSFETMVGLLDGFAIKPSKGAGGKGILVITGREENQFVKSSGDVISITRIKWHLSNILAGLYTLAAAPDVAIIEDLIHTIDMFQALSYAGVPDIRIIVFKGYPVMSMLRLSTRVSDGKANLHKGAVGVGLDIASGRSLHAIQYARRITHHPDNGIPLDTIVIPDWRNMLLLAARSFEMTGLGYIGADLVVDRKRGPMLLELNARPGLSIQIANGAGLLPRLKAIEQLDPDIIPSAQERVEFSMKTFGAKMS